MSDVRTLVSDVRPIVAAPILLLSGCLLTLVALGTGAGAPVAALVALATALTLVVAYRAARADAPELDVLDRLVEPAMTLLPAALVVYFSFNGGGYFPGSQAFVTVLLALALAIKIATAPEPFNGFRPLSLVAAAALALFAAWQLLSASWSHAPGRALTECDRTLLYLLAFLLFASVPRTRRRIEWLGRSLAGAATLVCGIALVTRVAPDIWPVAPDIQQGRLSYPITYWNALGLLAAIGLILCAWITTSEREPRAARVLGAAAIPVLATTLLFTFSRGAIAVAGVGLLVYALLARPRAFVTGVVAAAPPTAVALVAAYHANLLASDNPTSPAAAAQGHHVALVVALCAAVAAAVRLVLAGSVDRRLARIRLPAGARRPVVAAAWGLGAVAVIVAFFALKGPTTASRDYHRFVNGNYVAGTGDLRTRLGNLGNNRRIDQWNVALDGYRQESFHGIGAGTYENIWNQRRPVTFAIRDAHSLYVEVLGELGIAGLLLLLVPLAAVLFAFGRRLRGRSHYVYGALLAAALAWALRAGIDWDWEMPAITLWLFAAGGIASAARSRDRVRTRVRHPPVGLRLGLAFACVALAVVPAAIAVSQRRIDDGVRAFARGDCATAMHDARVSLDAVSFRPEPRELLAYCDARRGRLASAVVEARRAVARDPGMWQYRFDLAVILAADGGDGLAAAHDALRLDPREPLARALVPRLADAGRARVIGRALVGKPAVTLR